MCYINFLYVCACGWLLLTDKMKPGIVAKLALQCSDLYADAGKLLGLDSIRSLWPKVGHLVMKFM